MANSILDERKPLSFRFPCFPGEPFGAHRRGILTPQASKGLASPFLLTLDGYPTSPAMYAQGQRFSPKIKQSPETYHIDFLADLWVFFLVMPSHGSDLMVVSKWFL
jgi:hypothetical protein